MSQETMPLTVRQREVLILAGMGYTINEIAEELHLSPRTAKMHCDGLRAKYGLKHKRELIPIARRETT